MAVGQVSGDYLDPGSGPDYSAWRSYFSDPIFFSGGAPSGIDYSQYYPYFGSEIFREPASLGGSSKTTSVLGKVAKNIAEMRENQSLAMGSQSSVAFNPKNNRMIDPSTLPSSKNWTRTMEYARNRSSMKVFDGWDWTVPQDVQNLY
jgi:hypothetical protein